MKEYKIKLHSWLLSFGILSLFFFVYTLTLSKNWNFDGVVFAIFLRSAYLKHNIFSNVHFQHLLYQPLVNSLYFILSYKMDYLLFLQLFNMFLSLLVLFFFFKAVKNFTKSIKKAFLSSLILGFSFNFWFYATDSEVHMLTYLFVAISIYFFSKKNYRMSLFFGGLSILAHILNIFYFISLIIVLFFKRKIKLKDIFLISFIPVISYLTFFFYVFEKKLLHLYFSGKNINFFATKIDLHSFLDNFSSYSKLFFHSNYKISVFIGVLIFIIIVYSLFKKRNELTFIAFLFFLVQFFFHLFWEPGNQELKSSIHLLLILLIFFSVKKVLKVKYVILSCIMIFFINLSIFIYRADVKNNTHYFITKEIEKTTNPGALIIIGKKLRLEKAYVPYFSNRSILSIEDYPKKINHIELEKVISFIDSERKDGGQVCVFSDVFSTKEHYVDSNTIFLFKNFVVNNSREVVKVYGYLLYCF